MSLSPLVFAFGLFAFGWGVHVVWWRCRRPAHDLRALVVCLGLLPGLIGIPLGLGMGLVGLEWIYGYAVLGAVGAVYTVWYPAAQAASPTMLLVLRLGQNETPQEVAELAESVDPDQLCRDLIKAMVDERFAVVREGRLYPGPSGRRLMRVLGGLRRFLGLPEARG